MMNQTQLVGHVGKMPKAKLLKNGRYMVDLNIAVKNSGNANEDGEIPTSFIPVRYFGKDHAAFIADNAVTGVTVSVVGEIVVNRYQKGGTGEQQFYTYVQARDIQINDTKEIVDKKKEKVSGVQ
ncbi:single-stranded DNA-binding protein [Listeria kieliensis]